MPHQEAVTILAEIRDGEVERLQAMLGRISDHPGGWKTMPFSKLPRLHFGQVVVFEADTNRDAVRLPAQLGLLTNVDAPVGAHYDDLSTICGDGLDAVFSFCYDYPAAAERTPAARRAFLERHAHRSNAVHINRRGRTVEQIHQEERLRRELNAYFDGADVGDRSAVEIRDLAIAFVRGRADLAWALQPALQPALSWRVKERLHQLIYSLLVAVLAPVWLLALPLFFLRLRYHEKRDVADTSAAPPDVVRAFHDDEDYWAHNQMVAVGQFKQGPFRKMTMRLILGVADFGTRHIYNRGTLSGLNTIHFARWVEFDRGRRMCFCSNYDGSLESYMNDFIDKAAWGVNAIFGNGDGFPSTAYLVGHGITDEKAYKRFLPTRLVPTGVWFSAYPHLTTQNIANNEAIREGLSGTQDESEARSWLRRFGSGAQVPAPGLVARLLDGLPWDKICRRLS